MEDATGFEPANQGVAVPRLTTWLRVHITLYAILLMQLHFNIN